MNNTNWMRPIIPLYAFAVALSGCSQSDVVTDTVTRQPAIPFTIVASGDSNADIASATTYAWVPDMHAVHGTPRLAGVPIADMLEDAISDTMNKKGYRYGRTGGASDLHIGYLVMLGNAAATQKIEKRYGVQPGLAVASPDPNNYEKGTLIITVVDRRSGLVAWRSALQGFAGHDIPEASRRERISEIVTRMLAGLPARQGHTQ